MANWIAVTDIPHPIHQDFVAYYGNSKNAKRKSVVYLEGKDSAISHWVPLPDDDPILAEEYDAMIRVLEGGYYGSDKD